MRKHPLSPTPRKLKLIHTSIHFNNWSFNHTALLSPSQWDDLDAVALLDLMNDYEPEEPPEETPEAQADRWFEEFVENLWDEVENPPEEDEFAEEEVEAARTLLALSRNR